MADKFTHFVEDQPQQFSHFVPDENAEPPSVPKAPLPKALQGPLTPHSFVRGNAPLQQMFDEAAEAPKPTSLKNVVSDLGAGVTRVFSPIAHPIQAVAGMAKLGRAAFDPMAATDLAQDAVKPFVQNPGGEAIASLPSAALALVGGKTLAEAEPRQLPALQHVGERFTGYTSPVIPAEMQHASAVAKAIRPVGGIGPDFESNLMANIPKIKAFAEETGNPLHSQWEASTAARGLADKGLSHFKTNFLEPIQNEQISMRSVPEYQGPVSGEGRMTTLADIEKRISDINDMQRKATASAKTQGAQMSAEQALGLEAEADKLRGILYREIGKRTGVDPNVIRDIRKGYGQQYNIADTIDAARRARLGRTGAIEEAGAQTPVSKAGIIDRALDYVRGGQEYIADAKLRKALKPFGPMKTEYPIAKTINGAGPQGNR